MRFSALWSAATKWAWTNAPWLAALLMVTGLLVSAARVEAQSPQVGSSPAPSVTATAGVRAVPTQDALRALRIAQLDREINALRIAGRPSYFHRRRALGRAALVIGALALTSGAMIGAYAGSIPAEDGEGRSSQGLTAGAKALIGIPIGVGAVLIGTGIWALVSVRKGNANQARIEALERERRTLR